MPPKALGEEQRNSSVPENKTLDQSIPVLLLLAVFFPAIVAFGILHRLALIVPYQDDYTSILNFAIDYSRLPDFKAKALEVAAAQSNEYKLIFEHALAAAQLELIHHINFSVLNTIGNCFLLGIAYLLWKVYSGNGDFRYRLVRFLPISFLFFSLTYWENLNWTTTDLQNIPVVFFSLLAIYLLVSSKTGHTAHLRLIGACAAAALASLSSANGFLLGPIGLLFLLPRRAYTASLLWSASFLLPLVAYLYRYSPQPHTLHKFHYFTRPLFFLGFLGCAIPFRWAAALLGLGLLAAIVLAARMRFDHVNPSAAYLIIWILLTACLAAWVRGGAAFALGSRYSIYSILLLIFCYSVLAWYLPVRWPDLNNKRLYLASLAVICGFWTIANVDAYRHLEARRQMLLKGIELYRAAPQSNSPMIDPLVKLIYPKEEQWEQDVLTKALQSGVYELPPKQDTNH